MPMYFSIVVIFILLIGVMPDIRKSTGLIGSKDSGNRLKYLLLYLLSKTIWFMFFFFFRWLV